METHDKYTHKTYKTAINTEKASEQISEIIAENPEKIKNNIDNLGTLLFGTKEGLTNTCYYTRYPKECSDGSNLYTLIKINNKNVIIKVGAGEFNTEVFNQKEINKNQDIHEGYRQIKGFSHTPMPLFVVNQIDSHFASDKQKRNRKENPKEYLKNNSVIVVPKRKQAYLKKNGDINFNDINILQGNTAIKKLGTALFETKFNAREIVKVKNYMTQWQTKNLNEFSNTINYLKKNSKENGTISLLIYLLENMVSKKGDINQIYDLIQSYNSKKNQFE